LFVCLFAIINEEKVIYLGVDGLISMGNNMQGSKLNHVFHVSNSIFKELYHLVSMVTTMVTIPSNRPYKLALEKFKL